MKGTKKRNGIIYFLLGFILVLFICCILITALGIFGSFLPDPANLESRRSPKETNFELLQPTQIGSTPIEAPEVTPAEEEMPIPTSTSLPPTTEPQKETETTEPPQLIIDVSTILNNNVTEVEKILGSPTESYHINIGDEIADTPGGESRTYLYNGYEFYIDYDKYGTAKLFQIVSGLTEEHYQLFDFPIVLQRFGISMLSVPDISAPARYAWENYHGYTISIAKNGTTADSYVWTVQIYITP